MQSKLLFAFFVASFSLLTAAAPIPAPIAEVVVDVAARETVEGRACRRFGCL
ncbi:hypothetical protein BDV98DRAFT_588275 [Pterulicium gracile]|uniref:Uncharacterized protein n=1 Tax=Pterulicium gracile TaxID=1884261 RepID=A0A5C3R0N6_9AGAR|nr:hypothetical protein BDV98DRAFT_588275 [Pterula gracilis]